MASPGNIEAMLSGISDLEVQLVLKSVFRYLLTNLRLGRATGSTRQSSASTAVPAENLSASYFTATTPSVANTEFAIPHNFGRPPYLLIPVAPLDQTGASIVRVTVSRPADNSNVYLKSPETSQQVYVLIEG